MKDLLNIQSSKFLGGSNVHYLVVLTLTGFILSKTLKLS